MQPTASFRLRVFIVCVCLAALSGSPSAGGPESVSGQARAVMAVTYGAGGAATTVVADTGTLNSATDARDASGESGSVGAMLTSGVVHAAAVGGADRVSAEASVADLAISVGGVTIGADFVMSRASAAWTGAGTALVDIDGMSVDGVPVTVTGKANQTLQLANGVLVINEQQTSGGRSTVAALHLVIDGVADVTVASATVSAR